MAKNLQAKLGPSDSLRIYDINKAAADKLAGEIRAASAGGASVEVVQSVGEAAVDAVSSCRSCRPLPCPSSSQYEYQHYTHRC